MGMVHKIVYYMIQGLIMPLIYYISNTFCMEPTSAHYMPAKHVHLIPPLQGTGINPLQGLLPFSASRFFGCTELEGALGIPMADVSPIGRGFACFGHI